MRVLAGEVPYRDFWTIYAPGQFYLLAGLFALFGEQWIVSPIAASTLLAGAVGAFFVALRRAGAPVVWAALGTALLASAIAATPYGRSCSSYPGALFFLLLAWAAALAPPHHRAPWRIGLWLGLAALFKHDVAAYSALGIALYLLLEARGRGEEGLRGLGRVARVATAALLVFAPPMLLLAAVAGSDLWNDLVAFPLGDFPASRPEALPLWPAAAFDGALPLRTRALAGADSLAFWLPACAALLALGLAWRRPRARPLVAAALLTFLGHQMGSRVQINTHYVSWTVFAGLALWPALASASVRWRVAALAVGLVLGGAHGLVPFVRHVIEEPRHTAPSPLPRAAGMSILPSDVAIWRTLDEAVREHVPEAGRLFVGEHRHDALLTSPTRMYFLLGRLPAVRYHELHPAVVDTAPVQREMVEDLARHATPLVILRTSSADARLDRWRDQLATSVPGVGATLFDEVLRDAFEPIFEEGGWEVRRRREAAGSR